MIFPSLCLIGFKGKTIASYDQQPKLTESKVSENLLSLSHD